MLRNAETTIAAVYATRTISHGGHLSASLQTSGPLRVRFDRSCDLLPLFVARSIAFALAVLDFTESECQMIVGSMAADTYLVTHRDPFLSSVTANARRSSFSRTGLMQSFGGVYQ